MKNVKGGVGAQLGFGIVELLVALAISMVLLGGMYVAFVSSSTSHAYGERLSRLQENGRFGMYTIRREVVGAGYLGCLQDVNHFTNTLNSANSFPFRFHEAVYGLNASGSNTWLDDNNTYTLDELVSQLGIVNPINTSDILVLRGVDDGLRLILEIQNPNAANLKVTSGIDQIKSNDILMIADCSHAAVFQVRHLNTSNGSLVHNTGGNPQPGDPDYPGNSTKDLGHLYTSGAEILRPKNTIFYIRNNAENEPALFRRIIDKATPDELVDIELAAGVENMQVRYREAGATEYASANNVTDWQNVVSVRVGLLLRSDPIPRFESQDAAPTYDVDGDGVSEIVDPNDRRYRLVMSGTMGLRNRLR